MKSSTDEKLLVSLTFDDALEVHLDVAIPLLNEMGFQGTFFINLNSSGFSRRLLNWREVALQGHELGNHTIFHPAISSKNYISEGNALENYTIDRMRIELKTANQLLNAIDGEPKRTFAYPCSNPVLGKPGWMKRSLKKIGLERTRIAGWIERYPIFDLFSGEKNYSSLMPEFFFAVRGGRFFENRALKIKNERFNVPCVSADGLHSDELIRVVELFKREGNWLVFMFHGIGGGHHLNCEFEDFKQLLYKLRTDEDIRLLTFRNAAELLWG